MITCPTLPPKNLFRAMTRTLTSFLLSIALLFAFTVDTSDAQTKRAGDTFYIKAGVGLVDYAGERSPTSGFGDIFDTEKFDESFPFGFLGEFGYKFNPNFGIGLGVQYGDYQFAGGPGRPGLESAGITTAYLTGRLGLGARSWTISPYADFGGHVSFGGEDTAFGPTVAGGFDIVVSRHTSLFVEARSHLTFPGDALDNLEQGDYDSFDALTIMPALGISYTFQPATTAPAIFAIDGPAELDTGESGTFSATVNEDDVTRPVSYQWDFGDGSTGSGLLTTHTFNQEGQYEVTFTASNEAGEVSESLTVNVTDPPAPARIATINADPSPATAGQEVTFTSNVRGDTPITYEWDFGDGNTGTGETATHTFDEEGEYTVTLNASNDVGDDSRSLTLMVEPDLPPICGTVTELNPAFFGVNSSTLTDEARSALEENAEILAECTNLTVRVEGFAAAGERNPDELSQDRAQAVADFYEENDVPADRITVQGRGAIDDDTTTKKAGTEQQRRVDSIPQR